MPAPLEGGQQPQQLQHGGSAAVHGIKNPMWLTPERFDDLDFSPDLVEAINEDFSDHVGLSSKLGGLEGAVVRMRQPLLEIQGKLTAVQDAIKAELQALQQGLQRRQDAAAARATLELMQEVAASTGKVEKLLEEVAAAAAAAAGQQQQQQQQQSTAGQQAAGSSSSGGGAAGSPFVISSGAMAAAAAAAAAAGGSGEELDAHCRLLERVAGEAARLLYLVERGKHLAFVKALERRVMSCRMNLDRQLQAALTRALAARAWPAATHCLRGYLELGDPGRGEEGLRSGLAAPLMQQAVLEVRQQQHAPGGGGGGGSARGPLAAVVQASLARLQEAAGPLLSALAAPGSGLGGFDLLGAVLLAELSQAVADGMPGVFSPGNPSSFQANYQAGQALLEQLEALAGSRAAVERLRSSTAAAGWAKRWNLPVYFSLVFQDIAGTFEAAAKAGQLQHAAPSQQQQQQQLRLAVSAALWAALQRCVAPDVFLPQLADRFAKLAFQLLVRYDTLLQDIVSTRQAALAAGAAAGSDGAAGGLGAAAAANSGLPAGAFTPGSPAAAAGAGAGAAAPAAAGPAGWAGSMAADDCAVICADADTVQALVTDNFSQQLAGLLSCLPADAVGQLTGMLQQLAGNIAQHGQQVLLLVGGDVLERCMAMVRQLKGITATYRMTAKGPPVRHSHYVAGVLQPLRQLLEAAGPVQQLPDALKVLLARDVIHNVNVRYNALAEELLTTVKKTESSLKRLKKTRPGEEAAAGAAAMSDSDKICLQLYLDVQEHGRQIAKFGLAAEQLQSFSQLLATVTPPEQQQQQQPGSVEQQ
ncbi:hypothetical protein COO60DRAFT_1704498 [Scenedesmus sp. NREL 46B-D3]|nr:hypothetical protein COO60DRAFT_1704498 [Scenedesmus sp. NREL 46B-D3]